MRYLIVAMCCAAMLAACGQGGSGGSRGRSDADNAACALIADTTPLFGAGAQHFGYRGLDAMAGTCEFISADGKRSADIILYDAASLHSVTPQAQMQTIIASWAHQTETPLAPVASLGDEAQIATDLPGYQTQIAFRKGASLVLISARSGDDGVTGEQLARRMATAAVAGLH